MTALENAQQTVQSPGERNTAGSPEAVERTYRRIAWRLIPFLFVCYMLSFVDRINIGYAQLQIKHELGFSDAVYGQGAAIFFAGFLLFGVPSNLLLAKFGARRTLTGIMVLWGFASAAMALVTMPAHFYVARFLLGVFESGFMVGILLYLTYWFPSARRAAVTSAFMTSFVAAGIVAGPLSGWIMSAMNGAYALQGWQWMFLVEGLPGVVLGAVALFYLPDNPEKAAWLTAAEKRIVEYHLAEDRRVRDSDQPRNFCRVLRDYRIYILALGYFALMYAAYGITFWLPILIKSLGVNDLRLVGLYSAIPYVVGLPFMLWLSRRSDAMLERRWHYAVAVFIGAVGLGLASPSLADLAFALTCISLAGAGVLAAIPLFWTLSTAYLPKEAAPGGMALINSLGIVGGGVSPLVVGWLNTATGSLSLAMGLLAAVAALGGLAVPIGIPARLLRERRVA